MAGIDNLGLYGQITQMAKAAGGVDKLLSQVGRRAVAKAGPPILLVGVGIGAGGKALYERFSRTRNMAIAEGDAAEAEIRRIVAASEETEADTVEGSVEEPPTAQEGDEPEEPREG